MGTVGENYNVGTGNNLRNIDIAKKLMKIFKSKFKIKSLKSKIILVKDRPGHDFRYALNSKKIRTKLKWKNKTKISKGLNKTIDWYLNNENYYKKYNLKNLTKRLGILK